MDQSGDDQTCQTCKRCSGQEEEHGRTGDLTCSTDVTDAADSHNNGTEYKWKDHKVQCVHVDTTKKAGNSQNRGKTSCKEQTGTDTENKSYKDSTGDVFPVPGVELFHFFPPHKMHN